MDTDFPSRFAALPLPLLALELPQTPRPNVPPLDDQAVLIGHKAHSLCPSLTGGSGTGPGPWTRPRARPAVTAAHHQESFAHLDLGTLAGQVFHVYPQDVVASLQGFAALVHGHHVYRELGPVANRLHVQHIHLDR